MAGYSSASWAIGVLFSDCITKDTPPPFTSPNTTFGYTPGLTPVYLQDEERIQGLVYLLSLALRVLTLVEWVVRKRLCQDRAKLQGIYAGQPGRKTDRPSAELLLEVLQAISISVVEVNGQTHALLTPLTEVQQRLLGLWDLPPDLYEDVALRFPEPP